MTISYKWLCEYLPEQIEPEKLSKILTSIGLEVESLEKFESIKGNLEGLVVGEVMTCEKHPNADKLKLTKVNTGAAEPVQIVCGASNVAEGQKVVVATIGATIYPVNGEPFTIKAAKIRGEESQGMICAEDEIGIGESHEGIIILPAHLLPGSPVASYYNPYQDWVFEIGLTPNRMDAMSHLGVAKDVCAWLTHHQNKTAKPKLPYTSSFKTEQNNTGTKVTIENTQACKRYSGVNISNVKIGASPEWLQNRLKAIGLRPINNIVDITNFVLHETGQPLHAFDTDKITGNAIVVKNLAEGTSFETLDGKERKLSSTDLMICNTESGMCIGGVFGGAESGVKETTTHIFLESAWFHPADIRRTSFRHGLRTDAATHFEKGVDISNTVQVLKRAALLIKEVAGGEISSDIVDVYPAPKEKTEIALKNHYLKKLSGKNYHPDSIKKILEALGFEITRENIDELRVAVPFSKPDITLPADIVEEIIRIDGIDNIEIPATITISPAVEDNAAKEKLREKLSNYLTGAGYHEILTNSITNSAYYPEEMQDMMVKMLNNLSANLNVLRPSMLETALETIAYNINRKYHNLLLYEFGKTYHTSKKNIYTESEKFCVYISGYLHTNNWKNKAETADFFYAKGIATLLLELCAATNIVYDQATNTATGKEHSIQQGRHQLGRIVQVSAAYLDKFDIKQPVYFIELDFANLLSAATAAKTEFSEIPKYPAVQRDLAFVTDKNISFEQVLQSLKKLNISKLEQSRLFDVFESNKLGAGKKSFAVNFTFLDAEKTLTDTETDAMMKKIMQAFEKDLQAEIRK